MIKISSLVDKLEPLPAPPRSFFESSNSENSEDELTEKQANSYAIIITNIIIG